MLKKLGILFLMLLMITNLAGCTGGSYVIKIGELNSSQNAMSGNYNYFSGHYFKTVKLSEGKTLTVTLTAETKSGNLFAKVINSNGKTIKTLNSGDTVKIIQPGQYKLQVEGDKHKGGFLLSWKLK